MAFEVIDPGEYTVGKAIRADLFRKIKVDLDDLDSRVTALGTGTGTIEIFNHEIYIGTNPNTTGVVYWEAPVNLTLSECAIQIFARGVVTTGTLTIDIKKNTSPNPTGMTSVFTASPTINMASVSDYHRTTGTFNSSLQALNAGDVIRLDVTSLPTNLSIFRIVLKGIF